MATVSFSYQYLQEGAFQFNQCLGDIFKENKRANVHGCPFSGPFECICGLLFPRASSEHGIEFSVGAFQRWRGRGSLSVYLEVPSPATDLQWPPILAAAFLRWVHSCRSRRTTPAADPSPAQPGTEPILCGSCVCAEHLQPWLPLRPQDSPASWEGAWGW